MIVELLVNVFAEREKFINEDYETDNHLLFLVEEGEFRVSDGHEDAIIGKNNAMIILPGVRYHREVISPVKLHIFRFRTNRNMSLIPLKMTFKDQERIESSIRLLRKLDSNIYPEEFILRQTIMNDIINQYIIESRFPHKTSLRQDDLMEKAVSLMENNMKNKLSLAEISAELGISYVHFARRFKEYTGLSPNEYLNKAKMKLARELLSNEGFLIKQIAAECGYENEYYFSNAFKKYNGISPSEYRKELT